MTSPPKPSSLLYAKIAIDDHLCRQREGTAGNLHRTADEILVVGAGAHRAAVQMYSSIEDRGRNRTWVEREPLHIYYERVGAVALRERIVA